MAEMIATLSDACEREFGFMATRLFRVFKRDEIQGDVLTLVIGHIMLFQTAHNVTIKSVYDIKHRTLLTTRETLIWSCNPLGSV